MSDTLNTTPAAPAARKSCHKSHLVREWWVVRISAVLMVPLSIWFLSELVSTLLNKTRFDVGAWLGNTATAIALAVLIVLGFVHGRYGILEIVTDYVHCARKRKALTLFINLLSLALGGGALAAIFTLHSMVL